MPCAAFSAPSKPEQSPPYNPNPNPNPEFSPKSMADTNTEISVNKENASQNQKHLFSFIPKIEFKFPFPPFNNNDNNNTQEPKAEAVFAKEEKITTTETAIVGDGEGKKNEVVRFSDGQPIVPPPLKLETEECEKSTSPAVLWPVYALGGFLVLRWVWARWKERKARKGSSDDQQSEADD